MATRNWKDIPYFKNVTDAQWNDWHWQVENRLTTVEQIEQVVNLTDEERHLRQQLWAFVQSLPRRVNTDKRGNPVMRADGTPVTEPCLINTHELLTSEDF